jgi:K+-transporting ATPase ATPase C chain
MKSLLIDLRNSLVATITLALILCGLYPLIVWGVAQGLFPNKANGSLISVDGKVIGSRLLAQNFTDPKYFHPRPSAAGDAGYDGGSSGGSNLGPTSRKLIDSVKDRVEAYRAENNLPPTEPVPVDAVTASASGLDPHISLKNAGLQAERVAKARGMDKAAVLAKIEANTEGRDLGILGEPRVNVLTLNLALDGK